MKRRDLLASGLAVTALMGRIAEAKAAGDVGQRRDENSPQPNNAHPEPGNNPALLVDDFKENARDRLYRPHLHFTPPYGFMNDPNGLIFDGTYYHLYYQYNPLGSYAGHVHWGHAMSVDLYHWHDMPIAINENDSGEAYSGCVILDRDNYSGLFPLRTKDNPQPGALLTTREHILNLLKEKQTSQSRSLLKEELGKVFPTWEGKQDGKHLLDEMHAQTLSAINVDSYTPLLHETAENSSIAGGLVAIYTRATPQRQTQYIAWSPDGGQHFIDYGGNPVLDIGHNSFRDPKVLWHEPTQKWVMVVVRARDHKVSFYGSFDLRRWMHLSDFGPAGLFGVDYECPSMVEVNIEDDEGKIEGKRWILFVSVNPGGPQGGSITQYFVGDFDGERFVPEDTVVGLTDFAKDSYALQTYANMPNNKAVYFAWLNNWQYCEEVPNKSWRGTMTLPRQISLKRDKAQWLRLIQRPYGLESFRGSEIPLNMTYLVAQSNVKTEIPKYQALELLIDVSIENRDSDKPDGDQGRSGRFIIIFSNRKGESLNIGFDAFSSQLWLDRSKLEGFTHPFFTGSFSTSLTAGSKNFSLQLILDASTLEIFANNGMSVGSALIYPSEPLEFLSFQVTNAAAKINHAFLYPLRSTMDRHFAV